MRLIGKKDVFAFDVRAVDPAAWKMRDVGIYVDGVDFTAADSQVYVPNFLLRLNESMKSLERIKAVPVDSKLRGCDPKEIHQLLAFNCLKEESVSPLDELSKKLRFLDWGETTFGFIGFFVPMDDQGFLTCQALEDDGSAAIHVVSISMTEIHKTVFEAMSVIEGDYKRFKEQLDLHR